HGTISLITLFEAENPERSRVPLIVGYGLALVCLVWVLRDFHIVSFLHELANVNWKWVVLGMAFDVVSYAVQALRWKLLLTPFGKVHLNRSIRAVFAGLFANLVFPLRPGEFLRSYVISSSEGITLGRVLGSVGVERFVDLVIATASLAVVSLVVALPRRFERVADTLGIITLVLLTIIVSLVLYLEIKLGNDPVPEPGRRRLSGKVMAVLTDLHAIGTAPTFYPAVLASLLMPFCQVLALWAMMRSYGLHLSLLAAVVVLLVINIGVSLPNAPANFGSYQFFCVVGLNVFQVEKTTATGFSFFAFIALTFPFIFLGFAALLRSGLSLRSMREKVIGGVTKPLKPNAPN
ncbi:MAG TPA: lysylphosphatidylglycerol synthase transmembrane domain-containing protein, partial [Candidatus Polarisedimenticolia bacterium]|nr:lysylphosphatidylglycerol synthase transmembrane domain-containing protein [Candidatus Polarisedimenticolia bacterium]